MRFNFKKFSAICLAGLLSANMAMTALAADGQVTETEPAAPGETTNQADITIAGTGKTYTAYRLLDLTTSLKTNEDAHTNHEEGQHDKDCYNYSYTVRDIYATAIKTALGNAGMTNDEAIKKLEEMADRGPEIRTFADAMYAALKDLNPDVTATNKVFADVPQGYYLIVEKEMADDPDARSLVMLDTAGQEDITVSSKESVPTMTKQIEETDDSKGTSEWQDAGDFDIGDNVKFRLMGTLPENIDAYTTYKYIFHDNLSAGLQLNVDSIKVSVTSGELSKDTDYEIRVKDGETNGTTDGCSFEIEIKDVKGLITAGKLSKTGQITVEYTAKLLDSAQTGEPGNDNKAHLEFSNDPYDTTGNTTSETPPDRVVGFTYKLQVDKTDKDGNPLAGAEFKLQKFNGTEYVDYKTITLTPGQTEFNFVGLDSGKYKLVETKVPAGYNKADDIEFEVVATYTKTGENDELKLTGLEVKDASGQVISGEPDSDAKFEITLSDGAMVTAVVNSSGVHLPSTGGRGAYLVYGLGALGVIGGGCLYVYNKKKKAQ